MYPSPHIDRQAARQAVYDAYAKGQYPKEVYERFLDILNAEDLKAHEDTVAALLGAKSSDEFLKIFWENQPQAREGPSPQPPAREQRSLEASRKPKHIGRRVLVSLLLVCVLVVASLLGLSLGRKEMPTSPTSTITEFVLPTHDNSPWGITAGPDGNLWFTERDSSDYNGKIGRITPNGTITEFLLHSPNSSPDAITAGPDGNLWFTELGGPSGSEGSIGRITPTGTITEFAVDDHPWSITAGPDGNLWFTGSKGFGRITPAGQVTEFPTYFSYERLPSGVGHDTSWSSLSSGLGAITAGPDGNLWVTGGDGIGRLTLTGTVTPFQLPDGLNYSEDITAGPDGNLWVTVDGNYQIARFPPNFETITEFVLPTDFSSPQGIAVGSDGNLWFTEWNGNKIGRITPNGAITEFSVPTGDSGPWDITAGPDGNLWFTESVGKIGRITPTR